MFCTKNRRRCLCKLTVDGFYRYEYYIYINKKEVIYMAVSEAHKRASYKYNSNRGSITLRPTKEEDAQIRAAAAASGDSLQNYILQAVRERMEREQAQAPGTEQPSGPAEDTPTQGQA